MAGRGSAPQRGIGRYPNGELKALTGDDPRQQQPFAAAYALDAAFEAAFNGVEALAPAAPVGRFGVMDDDGHFPIYRAIKTAAAFSGQKVKRIEKMPHGLAVIEVENAAQIIANYSPDPAQFDGLTIMPGARLTTL